MIFRLVSPASLFPKSLTALLTPRVSRRPGRWGHTAALSAHQLRDIGIEPGLSGGPSRFALTDLVPRSSVFGHRNQR